MRSSRSIRKSRLGSLFIANKELRAAPLILAGLGLALAIVGRTLPAWALSAAGTTPAQTSATATVWIENPGLVVRLAPTADATPADSAATAGCGEVFDSADYQSMLLLPAVGDLAYVLDLASNRATAFPRALVLVDGKVVSPSAEKGSAAGTATADAQGRSAGRAAP